MDENDGLEEIMTHLRDGYNPPPETPREEMWSVIQSRLEPGRESVVSLETVRKQRSAGWRPVLGWSAAAAALVVLGMGIGRMTAPGPAHPPTTAEASGTGAETDGADLGPLRVASLEHLVRTESLLTLAQADVSSGQVQPQLGVWARRLLTQTRLLMDAQSGSDPVMEDLLQDLELVLVQLVNATDAGDDDPVRRKAELDLALDGLEESEVLPRIRAVVPTGPRYLGT